MTFPPFTAEDALRLAALDESAYVVDGGARWKAGRELTYRIPGVVTLRTVVSPHGNWSFVYSDPEGRRVMGTSVVEGDFRPPEHR